MTLTDEEAERVWGNMRERYLINVDVPPAQLHDRVDYILDNDRNLKNLGSQGRGAVHQEVNEDVYGITKKRIKRKRPKRFIPPARAPPAIKEIYAPRRKPKVIRLKWTDVENYILRTQYKRIPTEVLAKKLGRTKSSVYHKVSRAGLSRKRKKK